MSDLLTALALLTSMPIRAEGPISARALGWYPLVGALLGLALVTAHTVLRALLPATVSGALVVLVWAVLTGGLHLDGLTDSCDALMASVSRERRLEILRDVHLGAFGATGLVLLLIVKVTAAHALAGPAALWLAPVVGRLAIVLAATLPLARREGMALLFASGLMRRDVLLALVISTLAAVPLGWLGAAGLAAAGLVALGVGKLARERIGGMTGDLYGMVCEVTETTLLVVAVALHA